MSGTPFDGADGGPDREAAGPGPGAGADRPRADRPAVALDRFGLCPRCRHVQRIETARGSTFLLCTLARHDPRFAKYPPQPQRACVGFEA